MTPTLEVMTTALEAVGARPLRAIDRTAAPPLLVGRISPDGHTIVFGPGDSGKGVIVCSWVHQHVEDGGKVLLLDFEDHPEEWARRLDGLGGPDMFGGDPILHVSPLRTALVTDARGVSAINWDGLYAAADTMSASLIVIDSIAYAVPGRDPSEPGTATEYSRLIQPFGTPVVSLAHMNRMGDERYPFGSVFWHAGARITWSLVAEGDDGAKLTSRKHNNYEWQGAYRVTVDWLDNLPRNVHETPYGVSVEERIATVLLDGPADLDTIVAALEGDAPVKRNTVVQALRRGLTKVPKLWTVAGDQWSRVGDDEGST